MEHLKYSNNTRWVHLHSINLKNTDMTHTLHPFTETTIKSGNKFARWFSFVVSFNSYKAESCRCESVLGLLATGRAAASTTRAAARCSFEIRPFEPWLVSCLCHCVLSCLEGKKKCQTDIQLELHFWPWKIGSVRPESGFLSPEQSNTLKPSVKVRDCINR